MLNYVRSGAQAQRLHTHTTKSVPGTTTVLAHVLLIIISTYAYERVRRNTPAYWG